MVCAQVGYIYAPIPGAPPPLSWENPNAKCGSVGDGSVRYRGMSKGYMDKLACIWDTWYKDHDAVPAMTWLQTNRGQLLHIEVFNKWTKLRSIPDDPRYFTQEQSDWDMDAQRDIQCLEKLRTHFNKQAKMLGCATDDIKNDKCNSVFAKTQDIVLRFHEMDDPTCVGIRELWGWEDTPEYRRFNKLSLKAHGFN